MSREPGWGYSLYSINVILSGVSAGCAARREMQVLRLRLTKCRQTPLRMTKLVVTLEKSDCLDYCQLGEFFRSSGACWLHFQHVIEAIEVVEQADGGHQLDDLTL